MRENFNYVSWGKIRMKLRTPKKYARGKWYIGYYADGCRVDPKTIPDGYHMYECRHGDNGNWCDPVSVSYGVMVNFAGTFICKTELPIIQMQYLSYLEVMAWEFVDLNVKSGATL